MSDRSSTPSRRRVVLMLLASAALGACGGSDEAQTDEPVTITAAAVRADRVVHRYFSLLAHGPTRLYRRWDEAGVVLEVQATDTTADGLVVVARYLLFHGVQGSSLSTQIDQWINNQVSDAMYPGVTEPTALAVSATVQSSVLTGTETISATEVYEVRTLVLQIAAVAQDGLMVPAQSVELPVYRLISVPTVP